MTRETVFSKCRRYRYTLWREWGDVRSMFAPDPHFDYLPGRPNQYIQFIGLNPSTADEKIDDPTVRRCINYAKRWGFGAMCMTNLFAWRATDLKEMKKVERPISAAEDEPYGNDFWLRTISSGASMVIAAWGKDGNHLGRGEEVAGKIECVLHCLGVNKDGSPAHPLYLKNDAQPEVWKRLKKTVASGV